MLFYLSDVIILVVEPSYPTKPLLVQCRYITHILSYTLFWHFCYYYPLLLNHCWSVTTCYIHCYLILHLLLLLQCYILLLYYLIYLYSSDIHTQGCFQSHYTLDKNTWFDIMVSQASSYKTADIYKLFKLLWTYLG